MRRVLAYAAVYILWGCTFLAVRTVVLVTPPFSAAAFRFLLSGLLLLALSALEAGPWPTRREWIDSSKLGLVMFSINYACFFWAEQRLYSGVAAIVVSTTPVWIMLAEWLFGPAGGRRTASWMGTALGIAGVLLVTQGTGGARAASGQSRPAILVLLAGSLCWSFGSVWSKRLTLPPVQSRRSALQMITGGLGLVLPAILAGEARSVGGALAAWTWLTWGCFAYLIMASIVAFTAYVWLLEHEPAGRVASYAYVNPLVALVLGVGLAHERVRPVQALGAGLVLLGVFATLRSRVATPRKSVTV